MFGRDADTILNRHRADTEEERFKDPSDEEVLSRLKTSRQKNEGEYPTYRVYDPKGRRAVVKKRIEYPDGRVEEHNIRRRCSPFAQAFVYEKNADPVVLVGWSREVELYIEDLDRAIYHMVYFFNRLYNSRTSKLWDTNTELTVYKPRSGGVALDGRRKHTVTHKDLDYGLRFRTLPKKWLDEYDAMLEDIKSQTLS